MIHGWVKQIEIDEDERWDDSSSVEREEQRHLRREIKQLFQEHDILSKGCQ